MKSSISRVGLAVVLLASACAGHQPRIHGNPVVVVPCAIQEGDLDFHELYTTCMYARERYAILFDRTAHPVTVIVHDSTAMITDFRDGRVILRQPSLEVMSRARGLFSPEASSDSGDPLLFLGHEIGHMLFFAGTYGGGSRSEPPPYGTFLPDWIDEAVAIWTESEVNRTARMHQAALMEDEALDLVSFVTRQHPNAMGIDFVYRRSVLYFHECHRTGCPPSPTGRDTFRVVDRIDRAGMVHVDTLFPEDPGFGTFAADDYYAIASTILPFFHRRGGPRLVNDILDRMLLGRNGADLFAGLPGMPPDPADVSREWRAFVRAAAADAARSP